MYKDLKVTSGEVAANNVKSAPDRLQGTATENKNIFDKLVELFVAKYNALLDELDDNEIMAIDPITIEGYTISHANSGVTQGMYGTDQTQTPQQGGTFIVPYFITDEHGHLVSAGNSEVQLPDGGGGGATQTNAILYGAVDSTSTSKVFTATITGLDSYYDGVTVLLKNGVVTSASGFTININGLGAKPVYTNLAAETRETTKFNINYTMLFIYDSTRVAGGCWICYNGYDSNTNTLGYQIRTNSSTLPASDNTYRYRLLFTSADGTKYVPATTSTSSNATATRTTNTTPIDPFGRILYYNATTTVNAGANFGATTLYQQIVLTLGYSFNNTGSALAMTYPAPVYLKCTPQTDGSAVMDYFVQALPTTADGKIYILLGFAYSATSVELVLEHPVYEYKDGAIRLYTNSASGGTPDYDDLSNKPSIEGITLTGAKTYEDLNLNRLTNIEIENIMNS